MTNSIDLHKTINSEVNFPESPLTQAIIDIRFSEESSFDIDEAKAFLMDYLKDSHPVVSELYRHNVAVISEENECSTHSSSNKVGYAFLSNDKRDIFEVSLFGVSFNRLTPYQSWEVFSGNAEKIWTAFSKHYTNLVIKRLAIRYINKIDIPSRGFEIRDYFNTLPEIAKNIPQTVENYFFRVQIPLNHIQATLVLNQATLPYDEDNNISSLLLDIDIYSESISANGNFWAYFNKLRDEKNMVYTSCLTDKAKELYIKCQP